VQDELRGRLQLQTRPQGGGTIATVEVPVGTPGSAG